MRDAGAARPIRTAAIANLGCKVNQSETEGAALGLRERVIAIEDVDPGRRDRVVGRILSVSRSPYPIAPRLLTMVRASSRPIASPPSSSGAASHAS